MANVSTHFSATILDSFGVKKSVDAYLNVPDTTTLADLALDMGTWLTDLNAVTDGAITASRVLLTPAPPGGLRGTPVAGSYNARTGQLGFSAAGTTKLWGQAIPALAASAIANSKVPNTGSMGTYTALLTGGLYTNPDNLVLSVLKKTAIGDRSNRKQQQPLTTSKF